MVFSIIAVRDLFAWRRLVALGVLLFSVVPVAIAEEGAPGPTYTEFLDNGVIRVGIETKAYGGAITYVSVSGDDRNLVNNHDRGRQIQQSYYAGDSLDRTSEGQRKSWSPWPWNPIQVGDSYGNSARVVKVRHRGRTIYVKTVPLLWDMKNETAECHLETWLRLHQNTVHVRNKLTSYRTDHRWSVRLCSQELPAVYSIGDLFRLVTYAGPVPFTQAPVVEIHNNGPPWATFGHDQPTEKWAALVNDANWGLGVYNKKTELFTGGFHGTNGGGEFDDSTGYVSPLRKVALRPKDTFTYEYDLIVGTVDEIRAFAYKTEGHRYQSTPPAGE